MARPWIGAVGMMASPKKAPGEAQRTGGGKRAIWIAAGVFLVALAVRLVYLCQSADNPTFVAPTVDSATYDENARALADGRGMSLGFFWQPFFYPFFLSLVYRLSHSSIIAVKLIQAVLGSLTCALTYRLGERAFDRRVGILAGVMTALYGPLVFLEGELLAAGWAAFWSVVLVGLFLRTAEKKKLWLCLVLGVCGALSIITRPTFVPFFLAGCLWLGVKLYRSSARPRFLAGGLIALLAGFLLVALPVGRQCARLTGRFTILPFSGGINLYVGNNPNVCETLTARPGWEWDRIATLPNQQGITGVWEMSSFFTQRVLDYVSTQPLDFAAGLARKAWQFVSSREIPRNLDLYMFDEWSSVLGSLAWKIGGFGFPFGILLPLAIVGLVRSWRQVPGPMLLFVMLYPLAIILVFVTARYRVPVVPVVSILSAVGVSGIVQMLRRGQWGRVAIAGAAVVGMGALFSLPPTFCEERPNYEAELQRLVGDTAAARGHPQQAIQHYSQALRLKADYAEVYNNLGTELRKVGQLDKAAQCYAETIRLSPDSFEAHNNLGTMLIAAGRAAEAIRHFEEALRLRPNSREAHYNMAKALAEQQDIDRASAHYQAVLRLEPDRSAPHDNLTYRAHYELGLLLLGKGRFAEAAGHFSQVLRLRPDHAEAHCNLAAAYMMTGRLDEAVSHLSEALQLRPDYADAHYNMARARAAQGDYDRAVAHYRQVLRLEPARLEALNGLGWLLATRPDANQADVSEAVQLAEQASERTGHRVPEVLDTLAAAYAAAGRFPEAIATAQQAMELAAAAGQEGLAGGIRDRLELYESQRPYRPQP